MIGKKNPSNSSACVRDETGTASGTFKKDRAAGLENWILHEFVHRKVSSRQLKFFGRSFAYI